MLTSRRPVQGKDTTSRSPSLYSRDWSGVVEILKRIARSVRLASTTTAARAVGQGSHPQTRSRTTAKKRRFMTGSLSLENRRRHGPVGGKRRQGRCPTILRPVPERSTRHDPLRRG